MSVITELNKIIEDLHLLKHMFYQAWSNGQLSREILQDYAIQYYNQVESFPTFISMTHSKCRKNIKVRKKLLENLVDEELHGTDHPALWMQFAEGLGLKREQVVDQALLPETQAMVDTYYDLANRDWRDGLCALYAYEYQVPEVAKSKIAGLKQFYNIDDAKTLEFFTAHQVYDVGHANQVAALIEEYVEPEQAKVATQEASLALWNFLNGMCRVSGIQC